MSAGGTAGISTAEATWSFKSALYALGQAVFDGTATVCVGLPDSWSAAQIVSFGLVTATEDPASLGASRTRDVNLECVVDIWVVSGGTQPAQLQVEQDAWALVAAYESQLHYIVDGVDGSVLGGAVQWCFITRAEQADETIKDPTQGRGVHLKVTVTARARIRQNPS